MALAAVGLILILVPAAVTAGDFIIQKSWAGVLQPGKPFTIYFNYRLESAPAATVRLFFWSPVPRDPSLPEESTLVGEVEVKRGEGRGYIMALLDPVWARTEFTSRVKGVGFEFSLNMGPVTSGKFTMLLKGISIGEGPWPPKKKASPRAPSRHTPGGSDINMNVHVYIHHDTPVKPGKEFEDDGWFFVCPDVPGHDTTLYEYHVRLENPICPMRPDPVMNPDAIPFDDLVICPPVKERYWKQGSKSIRQPEHRLLNLPEGKPATSPAF